MARIEAKVNALPVWYIPKADVAKIESKLMDGDIAGIVAKDQGGVCSHVGLITKVNGEIRQNAFVSQLIFDIPRLIEDLSRVMTLEPGDLIATGTCAGVGIGFNPPKYLKPGDHVAITIEPIGTLENPVS